LWERTARTESLEQSTSAPRILSADAADAIEASSSSSAWSNSWFDAQHVELAFDVAKDELSARHWERG
jgi:hypothetical protein